MKITELAYLGPEGSYSHEAAKIIAGGAVLSARHDLSEVVHSAGGSVAAVVPIENSIEGTVNICMDMLIFEVGLFITRELIMDINHCLFALNGTAVDKIKRIVTHPQAYAQCRRFIERHFPAADIEFTRSTSEAVGMLSECTAAIAGQHAAMPGINILAGQINDYSGNRTRFAVLRDKPDFLSDASKISVAFEAGNYAGGLIAKLKVFADRGISLVKLESRPHKSDLGRYVFAADFAGNIGDDNIIRMLDDLKKDGLFYKFLGNY